MAPRKRSSVPGNGGAGPSKRRKSAPGSSESSGGGGGGGAPSKREMELEAMLKDQSCKIDAMVQKNEELQKEVNELKERINVLQSPTDTSQIRREQVDQGRYELRILGDIKKNVYTSSKVEGHDGELLRVAIYCNGEKITSGPFASAKFEIVVIEGKFSAIEQGNWSAETFQKSIVKPREEMGPILKDNYMAEFVEGEAVLDGLVFMDNSSWVRGKKWRLGIKMLGSSGVRVREAISNLIRVFDRHGKEKPHPPLLTHGVECLEKVGKTRASDLKNKKICTVEDFLRLYNRNPSRLLKILGIKSEHDKSWKTMIDHAKECDVGPNLYSYKKKNTVLFFNSVYQVVGAEFQDHYSPLDKLPDSKKILVTKWKKGFYKSVKNRNIRADFIMVNEQILPIEHDVTGIPTDNDVQQNGQADVQGVNTNYSDYDASTAYLDQLPGTNTDAGQSADQADTQDVTTSSSDSNHQYNIETDADQNARPDHSIVQQYNLIRDQSAGVQDIQQVNADTFLPDSDVQLPDTEADANHVRPDYNLDETSIQEMEQEGSFSAMYYHTPDHENLSDIMETCNDNGSLEEILWSRDALINATIHNSYSRPDSTAEDDQWIEEIIVGNTLLSSLKGGIAAVCFLMRVMRRRRSV